MDPQQRQLLPVLVTKQLALCDPTPADFDDHESVRSREFSDLWAAQFDGAGKEKVRRGYHAIPAHVPAYVPTRVPAHVPAKVKCHVSGANKKHRHDGLAAKGCDQADRGAPKYSLTSHGAEEDRVARS